MTKLPVTSRVMRLPHRVKAVVALCLAHEASFDELLHEAKLVTDILGRLFRHLQQLTIQRKIAIVLCNDHSEVFTLGLIELLRL